MDEVKIFKALSDATRVRIVVLLLEGEICVCDIMEVLSMPQSTVSRHLAYLKNAALINDKRKGVWNYYSVNEDGSMFKKYIFKSLELFIEEKELYQNDLLQLKKLKKNKKDNCNNNKL